MQEIINILPFCQRGLYVPKKELRRQLSNPTARAPSASRLLLWAMLGRIPVFIGRTGLSTQTAVSPHQTADFPLQPLGVSCLPDGDRIKSSADDSKTRETKAQCEWGLSMMAPSFLVRPHNNYISSARIAIQSWAMRFRVYLANDVLI